MINIKKILLLSLSLLISTSVFSNQAENWPDKPIKTIVSFTAGGTTDIIAREVGNELSQLWKQSVVVENKPGAAGNIGTQYVISSKPDGYTLLINSIGPITINPHIYTKTNFNTLTDLQPIILVADVPNVLVVPPSLNIDSAAQLAQLIKDHPGEFNCASTGVGTAAHLSCELMARTSGLNITHIPYKGADALNDLISGRVQFMFATLPSVMGHINAGKLKPLAVSTTKRSPTLVDIPTMDEAGFKGFAMGSWFGYFAPRGTPKNIVKKINADINATLKNEKLKQKLLNEGAEPAGGSVEEFEAFVKSESKKWKKLTDSLNIKL